MEYTVQCPICGADGTAMANHVIAQHLTARDVTAPGLRISAPELPPKAPILPSRSLTRAAQPGTSFGTKARNKWLMAVIGGVLVLVLVLAGAVLRRVHNQKPEPSNIADAGFPRTLQELNASYVEPPAGQNAATFYSQGFDALHTANLGSSNIPLLGKGTLPPLGAPISGSMKSALAGVIRSNEDALQLFARGAQFEQSRYPVDLTRGIETPFPHLAKVKGAVQLVELAGLLHAESHDGNQAANDLLTALALARSLQPEPSLISQFVRAASINIAVRAWEQTVNRTSLPSESLGKLLKAFQKLEDDEARGEGFNHGLAAERATWIALAGTPQKLLELVSAPDALQI
ncbi:MAG: hypothetical protein ACREIC_11490, partial [Limisphaerales bacterium]